MNIDVIRTGIGQSTIYQPINLAAVRYVPQVVEAHIVGMVGPHRDQTTADNLRDDVGLRESPARLRMNKYRAGGPIDANRPAEMIGAEQYGRADRGF